MKDLLLVAKQKFRDSFLKIQGLASTSIPIPNPNIYFKVERNTIMHQNCTLQVQLPQMVNDSKIGHHKSLSLN